MLMLTKILCRVVVVRIPYTTLALLLPLTSYPRNDRYFQHFSINFVDLRKLDVTLLKQEVK